MLLELWLWLWWRRYIMLFNNFNFTIIIEWNRTSRFQPIKEWEWKFTQTLISTSIEALFLLFYLKKRRALLYNPRMHGKKQEEMIRLVWWFRLNYTIVSHLAIKLINFFFFLYATDSLFYVTQNHTEGALNWFSTARDDKKMLHERKVMQNLSNATTKIQLNSIPEKKTSKRETFFSSYLGNARSDTEKKRYEVYSQTSLSCSSVLALLFLHASFFFFARIQAFPPFLFAFYLLFSYTKILFVLLWRVLRRCEVAENHRQFPCFYGFPFWFLAFSTGKREKKWANDLDGWMVKEA